MFEKPISEISKEDIVALVANAQREDQRLDYKEAFATRKEDRQAFILHVAGMANSRGGCIIIGIKEKRGDDGKPTGEPEAVCGLPDVNLDDEVLRLASAIRDSVTPRLMPAPEVRVVTTDDGPVVVVRVRRSLAKPHMFGNRFYARQGAQTLPLEVEQVRGEFLENDALARRLRDFRVERLSEILGGDSSTLLARPASMVVHVCPFEAFTSSRSVDVARINSLHIAPPGRLGGFTYRLTFLGAVSFSGDAGSASEYLLVLRNGCVEYATAEAVRGPDSNRAVPCFMVHGVSNLLAVDIPRVIDELGEEVAPFPLAIMVSFHGTRGAHGAIDGMKYGRTMKVHEDQAILQEVIVWDKPADWGVAMRPVLDAVWQSVGLDRCEQYDAQGHFRYRQ